MISHHNPHLFLTFFPSLTLKSTKRDIFYPHSLLIFTLELDTIFNEEIAKFAKIWCNDQATTKIDDEIKAIIEIMKVEEQDNTTWYTEILANKHVNERIDSLIAGFHVYIEARHRLGMQEP